MCITRLVALATGVEQALIGQAIAIVVKAIAKCLIRLGCLSATGALTPSALSASLCAIGAHACVFATGTRCAFSAATNLIGLPITIFIDAVWCAIGVALLQCGQDAVFACAEELSSTHLTTLCAGANTGSLSRTVVAFLAGCKTRAVFINAAITVVIKTIATCVLSSNLATTTTGVSDTFVNDAVAVIVNAIADFFAAWCAGWTAVVDDAIAIVVKTITANFGHRLDFVGAAAPNTTDTITCATNASANTERVWRS